MTFGKIHDISLEELGNICLRNVGSYSCLLICFHFWVKFGSFYWFLEAKNFKNNFEIIHERFWVLVDLANLQTHWEMLKKQFVFLLFFAFFKVITEMTIMHSTKSPTKKRRWWLCSVLAQLWLEVSLHCQHLRFLVWLKIFDILSAKTSEFRPFPAKERTMHLFSKVLRAILVIFLVQFWNLRLLSLL